MSSDEYLNETLVTLIQYPRPATLAAAVCAVIFCVLGFFGNLATVAALARCPNLRNHATTAFVLSLCVSDLLFCSLNLPLTAVRYAEERWTLGTALCKLFPVLFYGNVAVSLLSMVAITLNRYILISCHGHYAKLYTGRSICCQLFVCWGFAFFMMLLPLLEIWGTLGLDPPTFSCTILKKNGTSPKKFLFLVGVIMPSIVIIISYACIYWHVRKSREKMKNFSNSAQQSRRDNDDRRLTRMMCTIFICFLVCFLPLMMTNVFDDDVKYPSVHVLASVLAWASSVINPFIYAASNQQYRTAYASLFRSIKGFFVRRSLKQARVSPPRTTHVSVSVDSGHI